MDLRYHPDPMDRGIWVSRDLWISWMTHHGTTLGSRDPGYYRYATSYCYPVGAPTRIPAIQQDAVLCTTRRILSLALYPHNRSYYGWPLGVYPPIPQIHGSEVSPRSHGSSYLGIPRSMDLMDDPSRVSPDPMDLMDDPIPGIPMDTGIQGITLFVCYPHPTTSYCHPVAYATRIPAVQQVRSTP